MGRTNIVKMAVLPKAVYRFNVMPIKIPTKFFIDLERTVLNFIWKNKTPRIAETILYFFFFRATVLKTAWYCHKNKQEDQ